MRRNLGLKLLSLIIAIVLGLFVHSENNVTSARIIIPIDLRELPQDKIIVWQQRKQAEIEVRGPSFLVTRLVASPPTMKLRTPQDMNGRFTADLRSAEIDVQSPVQVVSIEPSTVDFAVEKKVVKELPVKLIKEGSLPDALKVDSINIEPAKTSVSGPESEVKDLQEISTEPIDLSRINKNNEQSLFLRIPGKLTEISTTSVQVSLHVSAIPKKKEFLNLPVEIRSSAEIGLPGQLDPQTVSVTVAAEGDVLATLKPSQIVPYVKLNSNEKANSYSAVLNINVDLPESVKLVSVQPNVVKVFKGKR